MMLAEKMGVFEADCHVLIKCIYIYIIYSIYIYKVYIYSIYIYTIFPIFDY